MAQDSSTTTSKPSVTKTKSNSPEASPTKKDDNAHIEQKNYTHVRKIFG